MPFFLPFFILVAKTNSLKEDSAKLHFYTLLDQKLSLEINRFQFRLKGLQFRVFDLYTDPSVVMHVVDFWDVSCV